MFTDADISVILLDERKHEENEKQNLMAIEWRLESWNYMYKRAENQYFIKSMYSISNECMLFNVLKRLTKERISLIFLLL